MLIIKKIFIIFTKVLCFSLLILSFSALSVQKEPLTQEQLINQVEYLFKEDVETLNYKNIVELSNKIIIQREKYPSEIIAKTYLLLAHAASNKGELETAFQFTQDGLAIPVLQSKIKLCLQIKLASIFSAKKQYEQLLAIAQQAINMYKDKEDSKYFLFALSYRSVAFAMLNQHENALTDLQKIDAIIQQNPTFSEHISLLAILASVYYHLGDYQTALAIQLKILQLRFSLNKLDNIGQTYYHLANAYYRLNRFNDAYNAYWEAKQYAEKKVAPIHIAHASQGLGRTLFQQKLYGKAKIQIIEAKNLFDQNNLAKYYLQATIVLAQLNNLTEQKNKSISLLLEAERLLTNIELTDDYIILYQLLANHYKESLNINNAYFWQKKYSNALLKINKPVNINLPISTLNKEYTNTVTNTSASNQTRQLTVKVAEQSELSLSFSKKYRQQQTLIFILSGIALFLFSSIIFLWLKNRAKKLKNTYEALEGPTYVLATPIQTKQLYQNSFNMARKFSYSLTVGYISISNWQELTFKFNRKIIAEVDREIANLINNHLNEFESAGLINEGEYLLLFPHQDKTIVEETMNKLISALKLRFFANLGEFSVTITYSIKSPNFQDIDPYVFLSQLSDSTKIA